MYKLRRKLYKRNKEEKRMKEERKYFGIYLNNEIPKLDKKNQYSKEVEIKFQGKAYLIKRKENEKIEKIEIQNEYKLKKEGHYEMEFINLENETFQLRIQIESSWFLLIFLLFFLGLILVLLFAKPSDAKNSPLAQVCDLIDLSILQFDVDKQQESENEIEEKIVKKNKKQRQKNQYDFDISFKKKSSTEIDLINTIEAKGFINSKVAPGDRGSFSIVISTKKSMADMKYQINFQDLSNKKPSNMTFKLRGNSQSYGSLQELEKNLKGIIPKKSQKTMIVDWQWAYETGETKEAIRKNDEIDTIEGEKLKNYQFKMMVTGEEVEN